MDKNNLIKIINKDLTTVTDLIQGFEQADKIHPFEIDLAISRIKDIYGELQLLKDNSKAVTMDLEEKQSTSPEIVEQPKKITEVSSKVEEAGLNENVEVVKEEAEKLAVDTEVLKDKEETEEPKPVVVHKDQANAESQEAENVQKEIIPEKSPETVEGNDEDTENLIEAEEELPEDENEKPVENNDQDEAAEEVSEDTPLEDEGKTDESAKKGIIADKFSHTSPSVNDMLAGFKKNNDLASRLGDRPIESMKKGVKLNDKIWYINELFDRDADLYNATIEEIDGAKNLDEALAGLFSKFKWDQEQKSTVSFLELVFRRFAN